MISLDTVSILEPNFKTSFTPICKTEVSNSFSCNVGFMQCTKSFDIAPRKSLHRTIKSYVLIPFGMLQRLLHFSSA